MRIDRVAVLERRRAQQRALIARAEHYAAGLDPALGVRAVVVFGSVARGDFNVWSDIDVLVVADHLPARPLDRLDALGPRPELVQPVAWTSRELRAQRRKNNPIAREALEHGRWLRGTPDAVTAE